MINAGITIAPGTDAGNIGTQHAGSYFTELQKMKDAGMSIQQILRLPPLTAQKCWEKKTGLAV